MFSGSIPALVSPFRNNAVDESAFRDFVSWQIEEGSHGLVPCGTTGEVPTLTREEHHRLISVCVDEAGGRVPVIAGCGSYSTAAALDHVKHAQGAGASAALVVVPYYNKPSQEGIYAHFAAIAEGCDLPIILYNVPSRTVVDMSTDTMARLAKIGSIVGVKDATGNLARVTEQRLACGAGFCQLSGNDDMALGFMAMGGTGCISVTANVAPRLCAEFQNACLAGKWDRALDLQDRLYPLHAAMFSDSSPAPAKYALNRLRAGFPAEMRMPLTPPSEASRRIVDAAVENAGLL